jgi:hypothetical protein
MFGTYLPELTFPGVITANLPNTKLELFHMFHSLNSMHNARRNNRV